MSLTRQVNVNFGEVHIGTLMLLAAVANEPGLPIIPPTADLVQAGIVR